MSACVGRDAASGGVGRLGRARRSNEQWRRRRRVRRERAAGVSGEVSGSSASRPTRVSRVALTFSRFFLKSGLAGFRTPRPPLRFASFCATRAFFPSTCFFAELFSLSIFFDACLRLRTAHLGLSWGT